MYCLKIDFRESHYNWIHNRSENCNIILLDLSNIVMVLWDY